MFNDYNNKSNREVIEDALLVLENVDVEELPKEMEMPFIHCHMTLTTIEGVLSQKEEDFEY